VLSLLPPVLAFMFYHFRLVQFTSYISNNSQLDVFVLCLFYVRLSCYLFRFHFRIKFVYVTLPSCVLRVSETSLSSCRHLKYTKTGSRIVKLCPNAVLFMCIGPNHRPDHFVFRHLAFVCSYHGVKN
jgi:hypothetical protein